MCSLAHAALFKRTAGASSACRSRPPSVFRRAAPRPLASAPHAAVKPPRHLLKYFKDLDEEQQEDALCKMDAAGFAAPALEHLVPYLSDESLEEIGFESMAVRTQLLKTFAESAPTKTVLLVDQLGTKEIAEFSEAAFDLWAETHTMERSLEDDCVKYIGAWEELEEGVEYLISGVLEKWVVDLEQYAEADKDLKEEVVAAVLTDMRALHQDAKRLSKMEQCRGMDKVKLKHHGLDLEQSCDDIIVTPNCCKVVKAAHELVKADVKPLEDMLKLIRMGVLDDEPEFDFARREDGSMKELTAALGGNLMNKQQAVKLREQLTRNKWDLYLPGGKRFIRGDAQ